jgi:hypothetical protein
MDGLGVQVTLGQPDVTAERMINRCLALATSELGYTFSRNGAGPSRRKRGAKG